MQHHTTYILFSYFFVQFSCNCCECFCGMVISKHPPIVVAPRSTAKQAVCHSQKKLTKSLTKLTMSLTHVSDSVHPGSTTGYPLFLHCRPAQQAVPLLGDMKKQKAAKQRPKAAKSSKKANSSGNSKTVAKAVKISRKLLAERKRQGGVSEDWEEVHRFWQTVLVGHSS